MNMDKQRLLTYMHAAYADVQQAVADLSRHQLTQPGVEGEWSVKDIVAHLTFWHHRMVEGLDKGLCGEAPWPSEEDGGAELDRINLRAFYASKDRPADEIVHEFAEAHARSVAAVAALSEDDLTSPRRFPWMEGKLLWEFVAGETYEHTHEHMQPIRAWIERVRG